MEFTEFINRFTDCKLILGEKLSDKCGYKTGGRAKYFLQPRSVKSLSDAVNYCDKNGISRFILANGTNVLFSDKGFSGAIISTAKLKGISVDNEFLTANCGEPLSFVCATAQKNSLSGLECFCGVPGTVGGAAVMNAGAFGKNFSSLVEEVTALKGGKIVKYYKSECGFSYRKSRFNKGDDMVLSVKMRLKKRDESEIKNLTEAFNEKRKASQPQGNSCGSVFKNPRGKKAGFLIESAGLKGYTVGGAMISEKHANFIITKVGATSADVYNIIQTVKNKVFAVHGVNLKEEIILVGDFSETYC